MGTIYSLYLFHEPVIANCVILLGFAGIIEILGDLRSRIWIYSKVDCIHDTYNKTNKLLESCQRSGIFHNSVEIIKWVKRVEHENITQFLTLNLFILVWYEKCNDI